MHSFKRLGVLGDASGAGFDFKNSEVPEFKAVALSQLADYLVQKVLYDLLDDDALAFCLVGNSINQFFFRDGMHMWFLYKNK